MLHVKVNLHFLKACGQARVDQARPELVRVCPLERQVRPKNLRFQANDRAYCSDR